MRWVKCLFLGAGAFLVGCGGAEDEPLPVLMDVCAAQHLENGVLVCDELHAEAPFVHLPASSETRVIAGLQYESFVTTDGREFPYGIDPMHDPETNRHALALYELELEDGHVKSFRPYVMFDDAVFLEAFKGRALEGTISRRLGEGRFAEETSLPVRIEILDEIVAGAKGQAVQVRASIANLQSGSTSADGSCMPPLTGYGDEATFDAGATVTLNVSRAPWMHGLGDDSFVFEYIVDGVTQGSLMSDAWYRGPIDLVRGTLGPTGNYVGTGHGSPGSIPALSLDPVDGGGEPCTAP